MAEPRQPDPLPSQTDTTAASASASASAAALDSLAANSNTDASTTKPVPPPTSSLTSAVSNLSLVTDPTTTNKKPIKIDAADVAFLVGPPPASTIPYIHPPRRASTHMQIHTVLFPNRHAKHAANAQH